MKRFNGSKRSHTRDAQPVPTCPLCGTAMRQFLGAPRCTHLVKGRGGDSRRVVNHGSLRTIRKRLRRPAVRVST